MKVRWSYEEQEKIYKASMELWKTAPGISLLEAVRAVQKEALPKDRQRRIRFIQMVPPQLRRRLENSMSEAVNKVPEVVPAAPAPVPVEPPKPAPTPLETALHELADSVASIVAERLYSRLHQSLEQRLEGLLMHVSQQVMHSDVQEKRKVLIVGLAEYLQHPLQQEFAKALDLRFKTPGAPMNGILDTAKGMDFVLVTKWSSHSVGESLKNAGVEFVFVGGGMQAIKEKLTEFYVL